MESLYLDKGLHTGIYYLQPVKVTSWYVAQRFNKEKQNSHILDRKKLFFQHATDVISLRKKMESAPYDENLEKELRALMLVLELMYIYPARKTKTLKSKHSASFSRSIRRLEERGLLMRVTRFELKDYLLNIYTKNTDVQRTRYLFLTAEGIMASKRLFD